MYWINDVLDKLFELGKKGLFTDDICMTLCGPCVLHPHCDISNELSLRTSWTVDNGADPGSRTCSSDRFVGHIQNQNENET